MPNYNTINSSTEQDEGLGHVMGTAGRDYQEVHINTDEDDDDEDDVQQQKNLNINLK